MCRAPKIRRTRERRSGAAVVELAVLLPFLAFITVIAVDWSRIFYFTLTLNACARNGALYAADSVLAKNSPYQSAAEAAQAEAPHLNPKPTVTVNYTTDSNNEPVVDVTVSALFSTITNFPGVPPSQTISHTVRMRMAPVSTR